MWALRPLGLRFITPFTGVMGISTHALRLLWSVFGYHSSLYTRLEVFGHFSFLAFGAGKQHNQFLTRNKHRNEPLIHVHFDNITYV
jgi:hypothetical protein